MDFFAPHLEAVIKVSQFFILFALLVVALGAKRVLPKPASKAVEASLNADKSAKTQDKS